MGEQAQAGTPMNFVKSILTPRGSGKSKPEADDGKLWIDRVEVTSKVLGKGGYGVVLEGLDHSRDKSIFAVYRRQCHFSASCINMLDHMLRTEPKQRVQVKDVLLHPWLTSEPHPTESERYRSAVEEDGEGEEEEDGFSCFGMMAEPEGQEEAPVELVMIRKREAESQLVI